MNRGMALADIFIVVLAIAILAIIAGPLFLGASHGVREAALIRDLQTVREQIRRFKQEHYGILPGEGGRNITAQLTRRTDIEGRIAPHGIRGPYLPVFPVNPFTGTNTVESGTGSPGGGDHGWYYNTRTSRFSPDDDAHSDL